MSRITRASGPALLVLVAFVALLAALQFGGAADAPLVVDPGAVVRFGLPMAKMMNNIGAAVAIGTLFLTCFALSRDKPEFDRAMDIAAGAAGLLGRRVGRDDLLHVPQRRERRRHLRRPVRADARVLPHRHRARQRLARHDARSRPR